MQFKSIPGNAETKERLTRTIRSGKIAHAQLFSGKSGGNGLPLALAYATMLTCESPSTSDSCGSCPACLKNDSLVHPDVHYIMPLSGTADYTGDNVVSKNFLKPWRSFMKEHQYGDINDWVEYFGGGKKQPIIAKRENVEIIEALSLKPFEAERKVMIVWMPELMHSALANGILKILEEPRPNTVFLLVTYSEEKLLLTIQSRTQKVQIPPVDQQSMVTFLTSQKGLNDDVAKQVTRLSEGSPGRALELLDSIEDDNGELFQDWMRSCFTMKFEDLLSWTDRFSALPKLSQSSFMQFGTTVLRDVLLAKANEELIMADNKSLDFIKNFSKVMDQDKVERVFSEMESAAYFLERNANAKVVFMDLSITIGQILREKSKEKV